MLSIAPRQLLHDVITGHKHTYTKHYGEISVQAPEANAQCTWHQQAVVSPFIDEQDIQLPQPLIAFTSYVNHYTFSYYSTAHSFSSLRGPPAQA
jgi:hypothetical protein